MKDAGIPTAQQLREELSREKYKASYAKMLRGAIWTLVVVAAFAIVAVNVFFSVIKVDGSSMEPTLKKGDMVIAVKASEFKRGDVIAFYYNNIILIKRTIGLSGESINIDKDGNVTINKNKLDEPYVKDKRLGDGDLKFPFVVPEGRLFVMGDHRSTSSDSRSSIIGTVSKEQYVGKVILRFWPISDFKIF
jgi:signal peptidase I